MLIPQPLDTLPRPFDARPLAPQLCAPSSLLEARLIVPFDEPGAHKQDIAGAELGALGGGDGFKVGGGDGVAGDRGVVDVVGLGVGEVVEKDGAADDAAVLRPF